MATTKFPPPYGSTPAITSYFQSRQRRLFPSNFKDIKGLTYNLVGAVISFAVFETQEVNFLFPHEHSTIACSQRGAKVQSAISVGDMSNDGVFIAAFRTMLSTVNYIQPSAASINALN